MIFDVKKGKHSMVQTLNVIPGHTYELTGMIRTESAIPQKTLLPKACISVWSRSLNKMLGELIECDSDTREFRSYTTRFTIPEKSLQNSISCNLHPGADKAWFDNIMIKDVSSTQK